MAGVGDNRLFALLDHKPVCATANHQSGDDRLRGDHSVGTGVSIVAAGWHSHGSLEINEK
jgi:hypothetical protein